MRIKMLGQRPGFGFQVIATGYKYKFRSHTQTIIQHISYTLRTNPFLGSNKRAVLGWIYFDQYLLNQFVVGRCYCRVQIQFVPRPQRLQRTVGTPPSFVVVFILHVMVVAIAGCYHVEAVTLPVDVGHFTGRRTVRVHIDDFSRHRSRGERRSARPRTAAAKGGDIFGQRGIVQGFASRLFALESVFFAFVRVCLKGGANGQAAVG